MNDEQPAAFFDLDGTLIRGDSQAMELRHVLNTERPSPVFQFHLAGPLFTGLLAHMGLVSHVIHNRSYVKTYRGMSQAALAARGKRLFRKTIQQTFFSKALDLMDHHRQHGHRIVVISATACHLLGPILDFLKPDLSDCTRLEFDEHGMCTGRPLNGICMGFEKADRVRRMASMHQLDLSASHAYSDHHADLPFLESVGHPVAVNPTPRLLRIADQRGWPVHRYA